MVDAYEPLVHGAENDGGFASPAVGVAMMIIFLVQEGVAHAEFVKHGSIGFAGSVLGEDGFAEQGLGHLGFDGQIGGVRETPVVIDGGVDGEAVLEAEAVVFETVTWGDVDEAGTG